MILFSYIIYFSILGFTLFDNKAEYGQEGQDYFQSISISLFNMYVLFTTSNFPDILFPFYKKHNITSIFFIGFVFFGLYLVLNLMLAVFYNVYRHQIDKKIKKYDKMRNDFLTKEFQKLPKQNEDVITLDEFKDAYKHEIRKNKKVKTMLKNIADEQRLVNKETPALNFEEFKFIYLFLEWDYNKKKNIENK